MDAEKLEYTLNILQEKCSELYEYYGLTENILTLQTAINGLRNEFDISDASEVVYEKYVQ